MHVSLEPNSRLLKSKRIRLVLFLAVSWALLALNLQEATAQDFELTPLPVDRAAYGTTQSKIASSSITAPPSTSPIGSVPDFSQSGTFENASSESKGNVFASRASAQDPLETPTPSPSTAPDAIAILGLHPPKDREQVLRPSGATSEKPAAEKKYPDYSITGLFQLDSAYFLESDESLNIVGDFEDGLGFRRTRLAAKGNLAENASFLMELDLAQSQARFVDMWGQFSETPWGNIRIGRFRQPFGMSELTGVRELPFLERPITFALAPFRQTGIMLSDTTIDERSTWAFSGFRTISDNFGNVYGDDGGYGMAGRATRLFRDMGDCNLFHAGLGYAYLDLARNQIQIASQDEVFVGQNPNFGPGGFSVLPLVGVPPFVNSGVFNVSHLNLFNLELAKSWGHTLIQSEARWSQVNLPTGETVTLPGVYVEARHVLTGEIIPYMRNAGVFGRIKPSRPVNLERGDWGAWEVAARFSSLDLNPLVGLPSVTGPGRRLNSFTLGVTWYMLDHAKLQLNWVNGSLDDPVAGSAVSNTIASRVQFDF